MRWYSGRTARWAPSLAAWAMKAAARAKFEAGERGLGDWLAWLERMGKGGRKDLGVELDQGDLIIRGHLALAPLRIGWNHACARRVLIAVIFA